MKKNLIAFYLDWINNYLTITKMAEDYDLPHDTVINLIGIGRQLHEANVAELKQS